MYLTVLIMPVLFCLLVLIEYVLGDWRESTSGRNANSRCLGHGAVQSKGPCSALASALRLQPESGFGATSLANISNVFKKQNELTDLQ